MNIHTNRLEATVTPLSKLTPSITDWSLVENVTPAMETDLYDTLAAFYLEEAIPDTLIERLQMADASCVVWSNLNDSLINCIAPHYYDALKAEYPEHSTQLEVTVPPLATTEQVELSFDILEKIDDLFDEAMSIVFAESGADRELCFDKERALEAYSLEERLTYLLNHAHF